MKIGMNLLLWTPFVTEEHFGILGKLKATGFDGVVEVEIFSKDRWWQEDPDVVLRTCRERLQTVC